MGRSLHRALRAVGFDYIRFLPGTHPLARRQRLLQTFAIELVLDVGANRGQFGRELRDLGYRGKIVSFEPLAHEYVDLAAAARADGAWQALPYALGAAQGTAELRVAGNSESSSLLDMLPAHVELAPNSQPVGTQTVRVETLDALLDAVAQGAEHLYLKLDTQGYERQVLAGAARALARIATVQVEMCLVPLYQDAPLFGEMLAFFTARGYELVALEPGGAHPVTGRLMYLDGTFHRYTNP